MDGLLGPYQSSTELKLQRGNLSSENTGSGIENGLVGSDSGADQMFHRERNEFAQDDRSRELEPARSQVFTGIGLKRGGGNNDAIATVHHGREEHGARNLQVVFTTSNGDFKDREAEDIHESLHNGSSIIVGGDIDGGAENAEFLDHESLTGRQFAWVGHIRFLFGLRDRTEGSTDRSGEERGVGPSRGGLEQNFVIKNVVEDISTYVGV